MPVRVHSQREFKGGQCPDTEILSRLLPGRDRPNNVRNQAGGKRKAETREGRGSGLPRRPKQTRFHRRSSRKAVKVQRRPKHHGSPHRASQDDLPLAVGRHATADKLNHIYRSENAPGPQGSERAHIVACATCLDQVNTLLDLPTLASRYPEDEVDGSRRFQGMAFRLLWRSSYYIYRKLRREVAYDLNSRVIQE